MCLSVWYLAHLFPLSLGGIMVRHWLFRGKGRWLEDKTNRRTTSGCGTRCGGCMLCKSGVSV